MIPVGWLGEPDESAAHGREHWCMTSSHDLVTGGAGFIGSNIVAESFQDELIAQTPADQQTEGSL